MELKERIQNKIENAIDEAFEILQQEKGIESGDVPPEICYDLNSSVETITGAILKYLEYVQPTSEPVDYILTYLSRSGWWDDVSEAYGSLDEAMRELEKAKSVQYMRKEFEAFSIESEDGNYYYRVEFDD